jgi:hypothetical protein
MGVFSESKLYKISSAPNYTITDITTGSGINIPTALLRALDGNIFIVSGGNGSIQKYNITEGVTTVFAATGTTYQCYGMTEAPDGTVYVSNRSSFSIQVIPSTGWSGGLAPILVSFTAQLGGIIYANDGFLYVSMAGGNLYRVNPTTGANTLLMNTGGVGLSTFSQGPDGFIYGNSGRNMYTLSITYQTYLVTRLLTTATAFTQCFGPDGTLYISDRTGKLYRVLSYNPPYTDGSPISFYFGDDNVNNAGAAGHTLHTGYRSINSQTFALYGSDLEDYSIIPQPGETRIWGMYLPNTANRNTRRNGNVDVTFTNNSRLQAFTAPRIGRVFGTYYFRGTIAEILIFPSDIGIPAIQRVEQYLANKWKVSSKSGIITPIATPTVVSAAANGGTITVTCGTPTTGIVLNIPTTPTGLTLSGSTTTTFTYTGAAAATTYPFLVYGYNGPAISSAASTSVTTLYTPGTPTVSAAGTTVNIAWTYGASPTGITFNVRDANNNWAGTSVTGSLTTSFTGEGGKSYSIVVFATSGLNRSLNSGATSTTLIVLGPVTFTQNYQSTTQTRIVGTAASTGAASYSGTRDSTLALSAATVTGQTLTWTGATGGTRYNGVTIGAAAGAATTSIANQSLYSAFDPKTISSCVLWLDAADSTTVTTATASTTVTGWADKSGQGYNMIAGTGTTTYTTYGPGPSIKLNTSYLYVNKAVNLTQFTVFSVLLSQTAVHNQPTVTGRPNTAQSYGTNDGFGLYVDSDFPRLRFYTGTLIVGSTSSSSGNSQGLILSTYTATSAGALSSWFNGAAKSTGTSGARTGTGQGFSIGGEWNGSAYVSQSGTGCVANVYEVIVYNRVLTTIQRQLVERYLAWKWGLQNQLDPGFPLNNFPGTLPLPNTFPGLSLWLDAADTTTITKNGANLSTIKDKSGTNNSWTAGGSTATTFGTIGGVQCITFTGFSQSFITGTYTLTQGQNLTIFMAFNNLEGSQVSLFNNGPSIIFNEGGQLQLVNQTNYTLNYTSAANIPVAANKTYVVAITSSITNSTTASSFAVVNGTIYTMNAGGYSYVTSGSSTFTASTFAYNPWSLGELVVYSGVLTNAQIQQVAGYLIYKWKAY